MSRKGFESSNPGQLPQYGAIFMSNKATKKECFSRKLLGLPMALAAFVTQVKAGMILFLFEFEKRELHGVFRAVSDGAINIIPHAYASSGKQFPAQVRFEQIWHCFPLKEQEFRDAIRENYFAKFKFNFGLSDRQVRRLLALFSSKKIQEDLLQIDSPLSKVPREIDHYAINEPRNEDPVNSMKLQKDGTSGLITSKYTVDYPSDFTCHPKGLIDNIHSPSAAAVNTHRVDNEVGSLILHEQIGNFLGEIRRSIDDRPGNEQNMNLDTQQPVAINPRSTDHSHFAVGYGIRNANEDGARVPSYIPNLPGLYVPYVPEHKGAYPSSDPLKSVLQPSFSSSDDAYPDKADMLSSGPTCPEIEAKKTLVSENPWDAALARISFHEDLSSKSAYNGNKDLSSSDKDHSLLLDSNCLNTSINQSAHMYSDHKSRVSVFDRLALPSETSKSTDAICTRNDEYYSDSSVDAIMNALYQNHHQWMKTGDPGSLNYFKNHGTKRKLLKSKVLSDPEAKPSKEVAVSVNVVADHEESQLETAEGKHFLDFKRRSKMQNTRAVNVDSDDLSLGQHKRRKLIRPKFHEPESHGDYSIGSSDNGSKPSEDAGLPLVMSHGDLQVKNFDAGEIPDHGEVKVQNCEGKEGTESCDNTSSKEDGDRKSLQVDNQSVFSPKSCKVGKEESDKNDVPNYIGDPKPDNLSSLESSEAGKLVQLRDYACCTIFQELSSTLSRGERSASGLEIVGVHKHDVDDTKKLQ